VYKHALTFEGQHKLKNPTNRIFHEKIWFDKKSNQKCKDKWERRATFKVGQSVIWTKSDSAAPKGKVGVITHIYKSKKKASVKFPATWKLPFKYLKVAPIDGLTTAQAAKARKQPIPHKQSEDDDDDDDNEDMTLFARIRKDKAAALGLTAEQARKVRERRRLGLAEIKAAKAAKAVKAANDAGFGAFLRHINGKITSIDYDAIVVTLSDGDVTKYTLQQLKTFVTEAKAAKAAAKAAKAAKEQERKKQEAANKRDEDAYEPNGRFVNDDDAEFRRVHPDRPPFYDLPYS
tara:strand:- start:160 stop:1029 length:870 start_codon:yes stop_codon:yes gene_type:complete